MFGGVKQKPEIHLYSQASFRIAKYISLDFLTPLRDKWKEKKQGIETMCRFSHFGNAIYCIDQQFLSLACDFLADIMSFIACRI